MEDHKTVCTSKDLDNKCGGKTTGAETLKVMPEIKNTLRTFRFKKYQEFLEIFGRLQLLQEKTLDA